MVQTKNIRRLCNQSVHKLQQKAVIADLKKLKIGRRFHVARVAVSNQKMKGFIFFAGEEKMTL